jgi:hypothetical protein
MAFLQVLLRVVMLLFAVRLIGRFLASLLVPLGGARPAPEPGALVRDRVCNTFLPRERALRALVGGREEHFCSAGCRDQALSGISGG